jgi:hypothetical protein
VANAPEEYKVEQTLGSENWTSRDNELMVTTEVLFEGDGRTWKVHRPSADQLAIAPGDVLRGWKNSDKGSFGIAKDRPQNGAGGRRPPVPDQGQRDDATGQSIERQTAAKCAAEMAAATGGNGPTVLANFEEFFDAAHAKITGVGGQHVHRDTEIAP